MFSLIQLLNEHWCLGALFSFLEGRLIQSHSFKYIYAVNTFISSILDISFKLQNQILIRNSLRVISNV